MSWAAKFNSFNLCAPIIELEKFIGVSAKGTVYRGSAKFR